MDELEQIRARKLKEILRRTSQAGDYLMIDKPVDTSSADLPNLLKQNSLVVVDCWAEWCGPCWALEPVIEALAKDYAGKAVFAKLDLDRNPEVTDQFNIMAIPTLLVFKNGRFVDSLTGAVPRRTIESMIARHI